MRITEETREFLGAIVEKEGNATTRQIRMRTDLTEGQLHHQYRKLEKHGLIDVSRAYPTASGSQMKQASLTEKGEEEVRAILSHDRQPERTTVDVVELADQIKELEEAIDEIQEYVSETLYHRVRENSRRLKSPDSN